MMTTRSFASLAFKLLGTFTLVLSIEGLRAFPTALYSFSWIKMEIAYSAYIVMLLLPFVLGVAFGVIMIAKSSVFARWAVPAEGQGEEKVPALKAMHPLAFSILGVAVFVFGIVRVVGVVTLFMTTRMHDPGMRGVINSYPNFRPDLAEGLIQLMVGAFLFFGAGSLSKLWHRLQKSRMSPLTGEQES
jgi:hypothetical protein